MEQIGATAARMHQALQDLNTRASPEIAGLGAADWIADYLSVFDDEPAVNLKYVIY